MSGNFNIFKCKILIQQTEYTTWEVGLVETKIDLVVPVGQICFKLIIDIS